MAYVRHNFKTKSALKSAVAALKADPTNAQLKRDLQLEQSGMFRDPSDGRIAIEGPHYPKPHTWYASVEVKDSIVVRVLS